MRANAAEVDPLGPRRLLILVLGSVVIFAGSSTTKCLCMPHLLIGFALAGGFAVSEARIVGAARRGDRRAASAGGLRRRRRRLLRGIARALARAS
jgi:hypothetical protein